MARFFRIVSIIFLSISGLFFIAGVTTLGDEGALIIAIASFGGIALGLAIFTIGDLLDRVNYLEDQLNMHFTVQSEDELPQIKCKKCGKEYDMDYPKCPHCKTKTKYNQN